MTRETKNLQKNFTMLSCREIVTSLQLFRFMANLEQSGNRIPDAYSAIQMISLIVTFFVTETGSRTKKSEIQLSHYCFK